jgi:hypothetical protein
MEAQKEKAVKTDPGGNHLILVRLVAPHSGSESDLTAFNFALVSTPRKSPRAFPGCH